MTERAPGVSTGAQAPGAHVPREPTGDLRGWLTALALFCGVIGVAFLAYSALDPSGANARIGLVTVTSAAVLLVARALVVRGHHDAAVSCFVGSAYAGILLVAHTQWAPSPAMHVAVILALAVTLPFASDRVAGGTIASAVILSAYLTWEGSLSPASRAFAPPGAALLEFLAVTTMMTFTGLILWQYRAHLNKSLTRERAANRELERANAQLREMDRMKNEFMNTVAHELNTPLTPIRLQLHLLGVRANARHAAEDARSLAVLQRSFARLERIVGDLLDGARVRAGRLTLTKERMDVTRVVMETVEAHRALADARGVTLVVRAEPDVTAIADAGRFAQVVTNLVSNALKFTPEGGRVIVTSESDGVSVRVRVSDSGPGVPPEDRERLFRPFAKGGSDEQNADGTGLGLFISRGIVQSHGGVLDLESPGEEGGATFTFTVPLADGAPDEDAAAARRTAPRVS